LVSPTQKVALVDNTSSEDVAAMYPAWLNAGFSVITPNKKAFSGDIALYEQIVAASKTGGGRFLNEATVGAGLPVIGTLKDLVATGDKVWLLMSALIADSCDPGRQNRRRIFRHYELHIQ
jgi:homoserine dehydrogenase